MDEKSMFNVSAISGGTTSPLLAHEEPQKEPRKIAITFRINCNTLIIFCMSISVKFLVFHVEQIKHIYLYINELKAKHALLDCWYDKRE